MQTDGTYSFKGIPYAAPPVGRLRFCAPASVEPWTGVRDCTKPGPACPQIPAGNERYRVSGPFDEDCLTLNVWTPTLGDDTLRPVVLFFHGGGYLAGSGSVPIYDSRHFAEHGIVAVTCNYRLASLGFLYLDGLFDGYDGSGNAGILDHIAALEWIRGNISAFGGDPDNVTIYGSSAGGISVCTLMAVPRARTLFHRAVPVSCAAGVVRSVESALKTTHTVLEHLGVREGDREALEALPVEALVGGRDLILSLVAADALSFLPVLDGVVLSKTPLEAVSDGDAAGIDLMLGVTGEESGARHTSTLSAIEAMRLPDVPLPRPNPDYGFDLQRLFGEGAAIKQIAAVYEQSLAKEGRPHELADLFALAHADVHMLHPTLMFASAHASHHTKTYVFRFMWPSPGWEGALGAFHGVTTPFLFDNLADPGWKVVLGADPPQALANDVHGAIVAFASTGAPGHNTIAEWGPYDDRDHTTMLFGTPSHCERDPDRERRLVFEQAPFATLR
jgi:para-nitrobenzyl esterase